MNTEPTWIETAVEIPPAMMTVEVEDGIQIETPARFRFRPAEPSGTGHFMR
jgi:hypothetical protein